MRPKNSEKKFTVKPMDLKPSRRLAVRSYLEQVDVATIVSSAESCQEKVGVLQTVVQTGLDYVARLRTKTVYKTEPPWMNSSLKSLINRRQWTLSKGNLDEFRQFRNLVNRERKKCKAKYYQH